MNMWLHKHCCTNLHEECGSAGASWRARVQSRTGRSTQRVNMPTFTHCHSQVAETVRNTNMFNARNVAQGGFAIVPSLQHKAGSSGGPGTCHGNTAGQSIGRSHMIRACPRPQHTHTNTASGSISTRYGCVHGGILPPFCQTTKQPRHREHQKQQNRRKSGTCENVAMEANGARQRNYRSPHDMIRKNQGEDQDLVEFSQSTRYDPS